MKYTGHQIWISSTYFHPATSSTTFFHSLCLKRCFTLFHLCSWSHHITNPLESSHPPQLSSSSLALAPCKYYRVSPLLKTVFFPQPCHSLEIVLISNVCEEWSTLFLILQSNLLSDFCSHHYIVFSLRVPGDLPVGILIGSFTSSSSSASL